MHGKTVPVYPNHVYIAGAQRQTFVENLRALVNQRIEAAILDFFALYVAALNSQFFGHGNDDFFYFRIRDRRSAAVFIAIPA